MVDVTDPDFLLAVAAFAVGIAGIAALAMVVYRGLRENKDRQRLESELDEILSREEIQLLRHRDFDAFVAKVNEVRARKGQSAVEREFLIKIQYNLMYALDESDF